MIQNLPSKEVKKIDVNLFYSESDWREFVTWVKVGKKNLILDKVLERATVNDAVVVDVQKKISKIFKYTNFLDQQFFE